MLATGNCLTPTRRTVTVIRHPQETRSTGTGHPMEYSTAITLEMIELRYFDAPRQGTENHDRHKTAGERTSPIDPPSLPLSGYERGTNGAGWIGACTRY